jgi:hypothetical protein
MVAPASGASMFASFIAWGIAWVVASLAHGLGGQIRAYLEQTQRPLRCKRLQAVVGFPTAHYNQKYMEKGKQYMSKENKTSE